MRRAARAASEEAVQSEDLDLVPSGLGHSMAARWLGVADATDGPADAAAVSAAAKPVVKQRSRYQGLGAQSLPPHKSSALTSGVEHRLRSKVLTSAAPRLQGARRSGPWETPGDGREGSGSESEDEGRGGAFTKDSKRPHVLSKAELLTTAKAAAKKRKRRKGGGAAAEGS